MEEISPVSNVIVGSTIFGLIFALMAGTLCNQTTLYCNNDSDKADIVCKEMHEKIPNCKDQWLANILDTSSLIMYIIALIFIIIGCIQCCVACLPLRNYVGSDTYSTIDP